MPLRQEEYYYDEEVVAQKTIKENKKEKLKKNKLKRGIFFGILIFSASLAIVYRYAMVNKINMEVLTLKKELEEVNVLNSQLKINAERNVNYSDIEKYAIQNLGMQKPQSYQIEYITTEKEDIVNNSIPIEHKNKVSEVILNIIEFFN